MVLFRCGGICHCQWNNNLQQRQFAEKYYHLSPYAYCAGDPVNLVDPDGRIWDIVWDIYSVASGVSNAIDNIRSDNYTAAMQDVGGVTLDVLAAIIPGVPAVGSTAIKITRAGSDIVNSIFKSIIIN